MNMKTDEIKKLVFEALGETSAVFMSKEERGIEIAMPTKELEKIGNDLVGKLSDLIYFMQ